jgi:chromosome segregation ATPase
MSDVMLLGVLRMPMPDNPADMGGLEWAQVKDRMRQAADEIEKERAAVDGHIRLIEVLEDEVARLRAELAAERERSDEAGRDAEKWRQSMYEYQARKTEAQANVAKLREALEPLAKYAEEKTRIYEHEGIRMALINHDVLTDASRRARDVLEETKGD